MFDTINIRIHGISKYSVLINSLNSSTEGSTKYAAYEVGKDVYTGKKLVLSHGEKLGILYNDSSTFLPIERRRRLFNPSHSYTCSFLANIQKDYTEIELSIPKWIKGHNLYQFVYYHDPKNASIAYANLLAFIRKFLQQICPLQQVDFSDVEINRLDLCFNQVHVSKRSCLEHLESIKTVMKRDKRTTVYKTSLMYKTENYAFKIYHKGEEFEKHDAKELHKARRHKGNDGIDIMELQNWANRVLRYEVSFRRGMFNYVFNKLYRIKQGAVKFPVYRKYWKVLNIEDTDTDNYHQKEFRLQTEWDNLLQFKRRYGADIGAARKYLFDEAKKRVTFTQEIFDELFNLFWKKCESTKTETSMDVELFKKALEQYNLDEMRRAGLLGKRYFHKNLSHWITYFEMSQKAPINTYYPKNFSKATLANIRRLFRALGLKDYNPNNNLYRVTFDYQDYKAAFGRWHNSNYI